MDIIKYLSYYTNESVDTNCHALSGKYLVGDASKQKYLASLNDDESRYLVHLFITNVDDQDTSIDTLTNQLSNIIQKTALKSIKFKRFSHARKLNICFRQKWFNGNCFAMKRELRNLGKKLQRNPNNPDTSASFHRLRKEYNKTLKKTKYQFQKSVVEQLDSLHENDPKAFWKTLDNLNKKRHTTVESNNNCILVPIPIKLIF